MTGDKQHDATAELNEALTAGFAAGQFEALGPFYTEDASLLPPRGKILDGRAAAVNFWLGIANRFSAVAFTTVALKPLGDAARRETGTYTMSGQDRPTVTGKYVFVWQLVDGEWQIESAIWNRNAEAGAGRRPGAGQGQNERRGAGGAGAGYQGGGGQGAGGGHRAGAGQGGGYRQRAGNAGGGYRSGGGRPSFQRAGGRRQGGGAGQGGGAQGHGDAGGGLYDGSADLYSDPKA